MNIYSIWLKLMRFIREHKLLPWIKFIKFKYDTLRLAFAYFLRSTLHSIKTKIIAKTAWEQISSVISLNDFRRRKETTVEDVWKLIFKKLIWNIIRNLEGGSLFFDSIYQVKKKKKKKISYCFNDTLNRKRNSNLHACACCWWMRILKTIKIYYLKDKRFMQKKKKYCF